MMKPKIFLALFVVLALALSLAGSAFAGATTGTWTLYPEKQATAYTTEVQRPIKADGSSSFRYSGNSVIPIKFSLLTAPGPAVLESILTDADAANNYSFLSFAPSPAITFNRLTTLMANYEFPLGNCHWGALRWSVKLDEEGDGASDGNLFIYYGATPNFTDCKTDNQSGLNMIGQDDLRYDTSQVGGTFYDSYLNTLELVGNWTVLSASLVLDGGGAGDQRVTLTSATVNDDIFVPPSGPPTPTCDLPPATIAVTKLSDSETGPFVEPVVRPASIQPFDDDMSFRIVDCKYIYNLATSSLSGPGLYKVEVVIDSAPVPEAAQFELRSPHSLSESNGRRGW